MVQSARYLIPVHIETSARLSKRAMTAAIKAALASIPDQIISRDGGAVREVKIMRKTARRTVVIREPYTKGTLDENRRTRRLEEA